MLTAATCWGDDSNRKDASECQERSSRKMPNVAD